MIADLLQPFAIALAATLLIEGAVLWGALASHHTRTVRLQSAALLSMATLPLVWFVLPAVCLPALGRLGYLLVAETFAPAAECALFRVLAGPAMTRQDTIAIVAANVLSLTAGVIVGQLPGG